MDKTMDASKKTIKELFQDKRTDILIPDYQRPYAWSETECQTLWDDITTFAFPNNNASEFDEDNEYFLGPIVTFRNGGKLEVIDGQQRLTTLMLLLRAFYDRFRQMKDEESQLIMSEIGRSIWKTDAFGRPKMDALKIDSEVATDRDKEEFLQILRTGKVKDKEKGKTESNYAVIYRFIQKLIEEFIRDFPSYCAYLPARILNNCCLLHIEAVSQDSALRIFSTLNDRGKPLSDADIFKAQFYKFYAQIGKKEEFIQRWKELEELCEKIFPPIYGAPMDELFSRYMYYIRAQMGNKSSTTEALRKFYDRNDYALLKKEETFDNLVLLAHFWDDVSRQSSERFQESVLRKLFILEYAPNSMWTNFVSVYFMQNRDENGKLDDELFDRFLERTIAFVWAYALTNPGVNALRTPVFAEMVNIVEGRPVTFADYRFDPDRIVNLFSTFGFSNGRPLTKAMLTWWAFQDPEQKLVSLETVFDIEHIYARNRYEKERSLSNRKNLESLGNKALLERRINIRASDYAFGDKKGYYLGTVRLKKKRKPTEIHELLRLAETCSDFRETDILSRNKPTCAN